MLKSKLVFFAVTLMLSGSVYAQGDQPKKGEAYKFAAFGSISKDDLQTKMDAFYLKLRKDGDSEGYIINYGSPAKIKARKDAIAKTINFRCYDCPRITFVDGPEKLGIRTVLWIIPPGADPPQP